MMHDAMTDDAWIALHDGAPSLDFARTEGLPHELRRIDRLPPTLAERPQNADALLTAARRALGYATRIDPADPLVGRLLRLLGRVTALQAGRLMAGRGPVTLALEPGQVVSVGRTEANAGFAPGAFIDGFHAALAADDADALEILCDLPAERLRARNVAAAPFRLRQARALQGFRLRAAWCWDELDAALREADPSLLDAAVRDHALDIAVPEMELMLASAADGAGLTAALAKALRLHARHWSGPEGGKAPEGLIALGPTAFAALARRLGWTIAVGSAYLAQPKVA